MKSGAKAERDALREEMLAAGCSHNLIAQEMRHRWGFRPREAHRHAMGLSQDQVAARFTEAAGKTAGAATGPHPPMIGTRIGEYERWPHGGRRPSTYVLTILAAICGTTVDRLLDYDDYRNLPDQERAVLTALLAGTDAPMHVPPSPGMTTQPALGTPVALAMPSPPLPGGRPAVTPGPEAAPPPAVPPCLPPPPPDFGGVVMAVPLDTRWVTAATALTPAAALVAAGLEPAPGSGSGARRRRRDQLLEQEPAPDEEKIVMTAAHQSAEFGEWAEATNVGPTTLAQIDEDSRRIAQTYIRVAPLPLMLEAIRLRNRVFTLLEGRQHPTQARHLYLAAGRICGLLAWMAGDVGRHREADTQARTGWLCAELADHDGLRAWIRATQSKLAYWDGNPLDAARLAEAGLRYPATDSARVLLASQSARAWARLGQTDAAHAALAQAEEERAAMSTEDELGGLYGFPESQQYYFAGSAYLWLREYVHALAAADTATRKFAGGPPEERSYASEMLATIDAATAHLHNDELDGAAERLAVVLALPQQQRLATCTRRRVETHATLCEDRYARSPVAKQLRGQIDEWRRTGLAHYNSR
jgi:transcriptional regulator with XRE-family HTH domain